MLEFHIFLHVHLDEVDTKQRYHYSHTLSEFTFMLRNISLRAKHGVTHIYLYIYTDRGK